MLAVLGLMGMKRNNIMKTRVIFKMSGDEPIAFFPEHLGSNNPSTCSCYVHVGQHGIADVMYASGLPPAKPHEFAELKKELERIGYDLEVVRKFRASDLKTRQQSLKELSEIKLI